MKIILLFFILLVSISIYSQTAKYGKIKQQGKFTEYITRDNNSIKINDTIYIGYPSNGSIFTFITQGNQFCGPIISDTKNIINKIKSVGNSKRGYKIYLSFQGYGLLPVYIDYEAALAKGEIK